MEIRNGFENHLRCHGLKPSLRHRLTGEAGLPEAWPKWHTNLACGRKAACHRPTKMDLQPIAQWLRGPIATAQKPLGWPSMTPGRDVREHTWACPASMVHARCAAMAQQAMSRWWLKSKHNSMKGITKARHTRRARIWR
jgi:hypothetical protein